MKLLHIQARQVVEVLDSDLPPYAVLSHTWGSHDASASEQWATLVKLQRRLPIYEKVIRAGEIALDRGISHLWVDSLCIDTTSSADLDEAVNGAYRRLGGCAVCLAYLDDLPADGPPFEESIWARCRYWKRAWTLQELLVPPRVEFFDGQWNHRGAKSAPELLSLLPSITGIPGSVLLGENALSEISLAVRMSWATSRSSSREEDGAYSLVAITGATMSVRYGEGLERAFLRLQEEILHDTHDGSIFAWRSASSQSIRGLLARSPSEFDHFAVASKSVAQGPWNFDGKVRFSSKGIGVHGRVSKHGSCVLLEIGQLEQDADSGDKVGVYLRESNGIYVRVHPVLEANFSAPAHRQKIDVARDVDSCSSSRIIARFNASDADLLSVVPAPELLPVLLTPEPSGTNLSSSDHPSFSHYPDVQGEETAPSSGSGLDDSSSDTGSSSSEDFNSDNDTSLVDEGNPREGYPLDSNHELERVRLGLTQFAYDKCRAWMLSARYGVPPEDRLPPSKRTRTASRRQPLPTYVEEYKDNRRLVVISHLDGYFHLACPFYISNPRRYRRCLALHDLQSIEGVISHLLRHHAEPPYCPICRRVFNNHEDRDDHVRSRKCEFRRSAYIDWVSKRRASKLGKRDRLYFGEVKRWLRVWDTVFPNTKPGRSPYLEHDVERDVSMAHDYWASYGMDCISDYFETHGRAHPHQLDEKKALAALHRSALNGLLSMVLDKQSMGQKDDGTDGDAGMYSAGQEVESAHALPLNLN